MLDVQPNNEDGVMYVLSKRTLNSSNAISPLPYTCNTYTSFQCQKKKKLIYGSI